MVLYIIFEILELTGTTVEPTSWTRGHINYIEKVADQFTLLYIDNLAL